MRRQLTAMCSQKLRVPANKTVHPSTRPTRHQLYSIINNNYIMKTTTIRTSSIAAPYLHASKEDNRAHTGGPDMHLELPDEHGERRESAKVSEGLLRRPSSLSGAAACAAHVLSLARTLSLGQQD